MSVTHSLSLCVCVCVALKIHMSDSSADILEKLGGYHLESRGEREVKVRENSHKITKTLKTRSLGS